MRRLFQEATTIWQEDGLVKLVRKTTKFGYDNFIRPLLPTHVVRYNGVLVRASRVGDSFIPWRATDIPNYEDALVCGIRRYVEKNDTVVIIGGGWGVSTVVAAEQVGKRGRVITYEGGERTVEKIKETVQLNGLSDRISIQHSVVGQAISLRDDSGGAKVVCPIEIPNCDVLVLDCEGAETQILEQMEIFPRNVVVETHGIYDAPKATVLSKLSDAGYDLIETRVAERRLLEECMRNGIYVVYAKRSDEIDC
ncbi:hypothetical protein KY092_17930 [Natronomonas gomsonensis]|uniref:hypothetical protein n=1 Tax=Natronomonas gomsonensis TaxID=1046043 RepID=UPI0020CA79EE|nr:hypothetical protein [Natronomonas gomsonensis]MCY4732432.1 hypothetical protein [Natronomonas gomsonensis]